MKSMSDSVSALKPLSSQITDDLVDQSDSSEVSEQFLRFELVPDTTALLPIQQLTEVLKIPRSQIVAISHMPPWVMGVYNWRGEILWMIDLGHLVGLPPWNQHDSNISSFTAIVLKTQANRITATTVKNLMLGTVVNRVEDIEWCNPDLIYSPPSSAVSPELVPFLRGYLLKQNNENLMVMDGEAIINRMPNSDM